MSSPAPVGTSLEDPHQMLSPSDVAKLLKLSRRTLYDLRDRGALPAPLKIGRLVRWPRHVILAWVAGGCRPALASRKLASR